MTSLNTIIKFFHCPKTLQIENGTLMSEDGREIVPGDIINVYCGGISMDIIPLLTDIKTSSSLSTTSAQKTFLTRGVGLVDRQTTSGSCHFSKMEVDEDVFSNRHESEEFHVTTSDDNPAFHIDDIINGIVKLPRVVSFADTETQNLFYLETGCRKFVIKNIQHSVFLANKTGKAIENSCDNISVIRGVRCFDIDPLKLHEIKARVIQNFTLENMTTQFGIKSETDLLSSGLFNVYVKRERQKAANQCPVKMHKDSSDCSELKGRREETQDYVSESLQKPRMISPPKLPPTVPLPPIPCKEKNKQKPSQKTEDKILSSSDTEKQFHIGPNPTLNIASANRYSISESDYVCMMPPSENTSGKIASRNSFPNITVDHKRQGISLPDVNKVRWISHIGYENESSKTDRLIPKVTNKETPIAFQSKQTRSSSDKYLSPGTTQSAVSEGTGLKEKVLTTTAISKETANTQKRYPPEVSNCFSAMSVAEAIQFFDNHNLSKVARVCKHHNLNGQFLMMMITKEDLSLDPFNLDSFEIKRYMWFRSGNRPKE